VSEECWVGLAFSNLRYVANGKGNSRKELQRYQRGRKSLGSGEQWIQSIDFSLVFGKSFGNFFIDFFQAVFRTVFRTIFQTIYRTIYRTILERSFKDTKEEERALEAVNNGYKLIILLWFCKLEFFLFVSLFVSLFVCSNENVIVLDMDLSFKLPS
jgi:hypothetical protein